MIAVCKHCGHLLYPSEVEGYTYECRECIEDFFAFEAREYSDDVCMVSYIEYKHGYLSPLARDFDEVNDPIALKHYADLHDLDYCAAKVIPTRGKAIIKQ